MSITFDGQQTQVSDPGVCEHLVELEQPSIFSSAKTVYERAKRYIQQLFTEKHLLVNAHVVKGTSLTEMMIEFKIARSCYNNSTKVFHLLTDHLGLSLDSMGFGHDSKAYQEAQQLILTSLDQEVQQRMLKFEDPTALKKVSLLKELQDTLSSLDLYNAEAFPLPSRTPTSLEDRLNGAGIFEYYEDALIAKIRQSPSEKQAEALKALFLTVHLKQKDFYSADAVLVANASRLQSETTKLCHCDPNKPVVIFFFPAEIKEDGFAFFGYLSMEKYSNQIAKFKQTHNVIVRFEDSSVSINDTVRTVKEANFNVTDIVLSFHGDSDRLQVSGEDDGSLLSFGQDMSGGNIYLSACKVGLPGKDQPSFAQQLSARNPSQKVFAAPESIADLDIQYLGSDQSDTPHVRYTAFFPHKRKFPSIFEKGKTVKTAQL